MRTRLAAAVMALMVTGGCGLTGGDPQPVAAQETVTASPSPDVTEEPIEEPTEDLVEESPSPSPSKKKATKKASPAPTEDPNNYEEAACVEHKGKEVSKAKAKAALKSAAARIYWTNEAPTLKLNYPLVKAISWHESGWTSNVYNCDGGAGLMQVMPETVDMINNRFGLTYDATQYKDNAYVGANYLAWLTRYMSQKQFKEKTYDLSPAKCKSSSSWCLLNLVISAYQAGPDAVLANAGSKELPNPEYVDSVRALMKSCYCDKY
ncbi:transglycosylase SLT domain-containing protein [Actinoplanes sp. GCM10030250]|uniref:transglycosylase SLT domain-containing protein n=1 Tax=Actinoplanes sp. GCM10030250 TaxID=3273376 RepID=UPI00361068BD